MPAPVVYEGLESSSGGGSLFRGIKFWVALRVPQRNRWVDAVRQNRGEVVALEKMADMLIADPALPKSVPKALDSYSWKFIEDALKTGTLPDKEPYLIERASRPGPANRPTVSGGPAKSTRVPFTPEDDRALTEWVRRNLDVASGNVIFKQFEEKNDRHPWSAWRDRWVKKLSSLPGNAQPITEPQSDEEDDEDDEPLANGTSSLSAAQRSRPAPTASRQTSSRPRSSANTQPDRPASSGTRTAFTPEEDERLLRMVHEARRRGENIGGKLIYEEFARENPTHPMESWRSRWTRTLARREEEAELRSPPSLPRKLGRPRRLFPNPSPARQTPRTNGHGQASQLFGQLDVEVEAIDQEHEHDGAALSHAEPEPASPIVEEEEREEEGELSYVKRRRLMNQSATDVSRFWRGHSVRNALASLASLQPTVKGFLIRKLLRPDDAEEEEEEEDDEEESDEADFEDAIRPEAAVGSDDDDYNDGDDGSDKFASLSEASGDGSESHARQGVRADDGGVVGEERAVDEGAHVEDGDDDETRFDSVDGEELEDLEMKFYGDFQMWAEVNGQQVDLSPTISGHTIRLWDLFEAFMRQKRSLPPESNVEDYDWNLVAAELGFDTAADPSVAGQIAAYHEDHLGDFGRLLDRWEKEEKESAGGNDDMVQQDQVNPVSPMSPGHQAHDMDIVSVNSKPPTQAPHAHPSPSNHHLKRRRDEVLENDLSARPISPPKRQRVSRDVEIPATPGPEVRRAILPPHPAVDGGPAFRTRSRRRTLVNGGDPRPQPPAKPARPPAAVEPETQDWRFDPASQTVVIKGESEEDEDSDDDNDGENSPSQQLRNESELHSPHRAEGRVLPTIEEEEEPEREHSEPMFVGDSPERQPQQHTPSPARDQSPELAPMSEKARGKRPETAVSPPPTRYRTAQRQDGNDTPEQRSPATIHRTLSSEFTHSLPLPPSAQRRPPSLSLPSSSTSAPQSSSASSRPQIRPARRSGPGSMGPPPPPNQSTSGGNTAGVASSPRSVHSAASAGDSSSRRPAASETSGGIASTASAHPRRTSQHTPLHSPDHPNGSHHLDNNQSPSGPPPPTRQPITRSVTGELEHWMSLGYPREFILRLLKTTNMDNSIVNEVLYDCARRIEHDPTLSPSRRYVLPENKSGVWTQRDDDALAVVDGHDWIRAPESRADVEERKLAEAMRRRIEEKHGANSIRHRREFLGMWTRRRNEERERAREGEGGNEGKNGRIERERERERQARERDAREAREREEERREKERMMERIMRMAGGGNSAASSTSGGGRSGSVGRVGSGAGSGSGRATGSSRELPPSSAPTLSSSSSRRPGTGRRF